MQFDDILKEVGEFGKYQKIKYFLLCLAGMTTALQALVSVFSIYTPKHRCALPPSVYNGTDMWLNQSMEHSALVDMYIPRTESGAYEMCKIYSYDGTVDANGTAARNTTECSSWVYDTKEMSSTVVTEWDLVCDKTLQGTLATTMYMVGNLVGSLISGLLSDFLGRRKTLLIGILGQIVIGTAMAFAPNLIAFAIFRFFAGVFVLQIFLAGFVLGMELIGPKYRLVAGIVIEIFWAIGFLLLIGLAYLIRQWSYLQLSISVPTVLAIVYYWIIPESPRWLLAKRRNQEAEEIIRQMAESNGTSDKLKSGILEQIEDAKEQESLKTIIRAPRLLCRSLIIFFNWFVIAMSYYGLSLNSGNMPGSLYVNLTLSAMAEVVGYSLCFLCFVAGRKKVHVVSMLIGGLSCVASVPVLYYFTGDESDKNTCFVALNTIGKMGVTIGFAVIYIWSAELFPTLLRTSLMGCSSMTARIGSIMAPVIADVGKLMPAAHSQMLPPLIFGVFTITGGLLSIGLPETTGKDLPETIAEANVFPDKLEDESQDKKANDNTVL